MVDIPINAVHRRVQYTSSGTTGPYSFTFETLAEADLAVYSGSTLQTLTTDYTVSLNANGTGSVTMVASSTGVIITILSNRAIARTADYTTGGDFTAASINLELDSLAISDQQLESWFRRSVQLDDFANRDVSSSGAGPLTFPYEDTVLDQAEKYIRYDSAGTALESVALTTISALAVPGTTVDNALARWSGLTGSTLDDSAATLDDNDLLTAPGGLAGNKGADIASATALVIGTDGDRFDVTGTTTVTSMTVAIGRYFTLQFDGAVLLTNGASLVLPGAANITTSAGDRFTFLETAADTVECVSMALADAADMRLVAGLVIGTDVLAEGDTGIGKHTIFVPASAMRATTSNGAAALNDVETTAGRPDMTAFDFDASADEHVQFQVAMPKSYGLGTFTARFFWQSTAADTDGVSWGIQAIAVTDNESIDQAYGTAIVVDDANQGAAEEMLVSAESAAITAAGTPADADMYFFRVFRDVSDANDVATEDARLLGVWLHYTTDAGDDT